MNVACVFRLAHDRAHAARPDRNVGASGQRQNRPRIARRAPEIDIAGDRRDAEDVRLRRGAGIEQAERVIDAGVDVENEEFVPRPSKTSKNDAKAGDFAKIGGGIRRFPSPTAQNVDFRQRRFGGAARIVIGKRSWRTKLVVAQMMEWVNASVRSNRGQPPPSRSAPLASPPRSRATLALSWPLIIANAAQSAMTTTDLMMLGRLSPKALAAGALGFNLFLPLLLFGIGLIGAVSPIAASLFGAEPRRYRGRAQRRASGVSYGAGARRCRCGRCCGTRKSILIAFGEEPELAALAASYLHGLQWALAPAFLFFAARSIFAAVNRTGPTLLAGVLAVGVNAAGNYLLVFGKFGLPALGVFGSGLATLISQCFMLAILVVYAFIDPHLARYRLFAGVWRVDWPKLKQLWRLGVPIGATITFEITIFAAQFSSWA